MKEFLSIRGIDYVSWDVANDAEAARRFAALALPSIPAVVYGGRNLPGVDLAGVAALLGIEFDAAPALPADVLVERLRLVLGTAMATTRQFPRAHWDDKLPGRERTYLELANHVVEIAAGFLAVVDGHAFSADVSAAVPDVELEPLPLGERAQQVATALAKQTSRAERDVEAFFGQTTRHAVLERCTWHAAQHTRQLAALLEGLGIEPERSLTVADLDGLPVPTDVWG